jgi:hypothetical protein
MGLAIGTAEVVLEHAPPLGRIRCAAEAVLECCGHEFVSEFLTKIAHRFPAAFGNDIYHV